MKKILLIGAFVLLAVTAVTVTGCAKKAKARDLGGANIIIGNWWADWDVDTRQANSTAEEKLIEYRKKIQADGNFKIAEKNISSWEGMAELASTSIMSGSPAAQIFVMQPNWALALYNQGLLYPMSDATSVDLKSQNPVAWNKDVVNAFTFNGKVYGTSVGYGSSNHAGGVWFNKRLFEEAGLPRDYLYDLQKEGTWTWEKFTEVCRQVGRDTNNDGIKAIYAIAALNTEFLEAVASSNGAGYVAKDASGKFINATGRPEFLQAVQYSHQLFVDGHIMPQPEGANWDYFKAAFHDGKAAMRVDEQYVYQELADMADDYGFVLFPKGPRSSTYKFSDDGLVFVIPSTVKPEDADKIMYAFNLWSTPVDPTPDAWKEEQYANYRDSRAVDETLAMIHDPAYSIPKYISYISGLNAGDIAWNMWWHDDPAQLIESVSQSWNHIISESNPK
jgi:maltose-binding protein MalE